MNGKKDIILDFIRQFRSLGSENCFSNGMCFWFATILKHRFYWTSPKILYDPIINHFACEIDGSIYDITGNITNDKNYNWVNWHIYQREDQALTQRLYKNCVDKIPNDIVTCGYCSNSFFDDYGNLICTINNTPHDPDDICKEEKLK